MKKKPAIQIKRKVDVEREYDYILKLEVDYELASLYNAIIADDKEEKAKSKKRLKEIVKELKKLGHSL